ncbi:ATP-dependent RNA helicase DBP3 [Glycine max]|nr:ATP-dependent RNA helicase DBP3 [Glycine max]
MGIIWVEVCLISAHGLQLSTSLWKRQWFAVGWIDHNNKYCTKVVNSGNANPVWRTKFVIPVDDSVSNIQDLALNVEVYSIDPVFFTEKLLGSATVFLRDLKTCEPEFLVSTPERLLELVSTKAIDISGVSMLLAGHLPSHSGDTRNLSNLLLEASFGLYQVNFLPSHGTSRTSISSIHSLNSLMLLFANTLWQLPNLSSRSLMELKLPKMHQSPLDTASFSCFTVIDGLNTICSAGHADTVKSIKNCISGNPRVVIFNDCVSHMSIPMVRYLLTGSICRVSLNNSINSLSSYIIQSVEVCTSEEDKVVMSIEALDQFQSNSTQNSNMLYILSKDVKCHKLVKTLKSKGYSVSLDSDAANINDRVDSDRRAAVSLIDLVQISTTDIGTYDVVVLPSFVPSIDTYVHILTKMARTSVNGVLHSFLTKRDTELAAPLIAVLEQCGQEVPQTLQDLNHTSNMLED